MADERDMRPEDQDEADGYYGEDEADGGDLDLSFLDEDDNEGNDGHSEH